VTRKYVSRLLLHPKNFSRSNLSQQEVVDGLFFVGNSIGNSRSSNAVVRYKDGNSDSGIKIYIVKVVLGGKDAPKGYLHVFNKSMNNKVREKTGRGGQGEQGAI